MTWENFLDVVYAEGHSVGPHFVNVNVNSQKRIAMILEDCISQC